MITLLNTDVELRPGLGGTCPFIWHQWDRLWTGPHVKEYFPDAYEAIIFALASGNMPNHYKDGLDGAKKAIWWMTECTFELRTGTLYVYLVAKIPYDGGGAWWKACKVAELEVIP